MSKFLKLKSIYELLNNEESGKSVDFFIPSYQRGYRWTSQQVVELLEDIWEFASKKGKNEGEFYCLQPIVVKKSSNSNFDWDVIDGQQRLTTIFIILKFLDLGINIKDNFYIDDFYSINYETRIKSNEFLNTLPNNDNHEEYIDFLHMKKAYDAIERWFSTYKINKLDFSNILLKHKKEEINGIKKDLENNVRVIWYEVQTNEINLNKVSSYQEDIEIFTRINMGKIPLTNAELIKALLIQGYSIDDNEIIKKNKQFELSTEWDFIEYSLQNDDFWYFINKSKIDKPTRIEFLFELIASRYLNNNKHLISTHPKSIDKYHEFHLINHYIQNDNRDIVEKGKKTIYEKLWDEVKNYFRILNEWYENKEFFHKIGYLTIYSSKDIIHYIDKYIDNTEKATKSEFIKYLDNEIINIFKDINIKELKYQDGESVRKVLLIFNIYTLLKNEQSNIRFQFDRYKKQDWDIEHIRSQTDKRYPKNEIEKKDWLKDIEVLMELENKENELLGEDELIKLQEKEFNHYFDKIQKIIEDNDGETEFDKDDIGNLTLLDSRTNRSYGNAFFPIKRKIIIENDMNGTFIPICTKNLFLKYYSAKATNLQKWTKDDAIDYKNKIIEMFHELTKAIDNE